MHVFKGHVRVKPKAADRNVLAKSIDLRTDQAIRIAQSTKQPVGIDLATDRFIRSIDEPAIATSKTTPMWIGTDRAGLRLWEGRIDELAVFDRALSADQISDLLTADLVSHGRPFGEFVPGGNAAPGGKIDEQIELVKTLKIEHKTVIVPKSKAPADAP